MLTFMSGVNIITGIFAGVGLAAASGFRVFLPLFILSLASKFDVLTLNEKFAWLGSDLAVIILGVATVVEMAAYLIPWLDHLLDAAAIPLAGIAGTIAVASLLKGTDPALTWTLAIIAGGGTATAVQGSTTVTRATSTATTGGLANPFISSVETLLSFIFSLLAILIPLVAVIFTALMLWFIFKIFRKKKKNIS